MSISSGIIMGFRRADQAGRPVNSGPGASDTGHEEESADAFSPDESFWRRISDSGARVPREEQFPPLADPLSPRSLELLLASGNVSGLSGEDRRQSRGYGNSRVGSAYDNSVDYDIDSDSDSDTVASPYESLKSFFHKEFSPPPMEDDENHPLPSADIAFSNPPLRLSDFLTAGDEPVSDRNDRLSGDERYREDGAPADAARTLAELLNPNPVSPRQSSTDAGQVSPQAPGSSSARSGRHRKNRSDMSMNDYAYTYRRLVEIAPGMKNLVDHVMKVKPAGFGELNEIRQNIVSGSPEGRRRAIDVNLRVALKAGLEFAENFEVDPADAVEDALVGMINSVNRYSATDQEKISANVGYAIRGSLFRELGHEMLGCTFPVGGIASLRDLIDFVNTGYRFLEKRGDGQTESTRGPDGKNPYYILWGDSVNDNLAYLSTDDVTDAMADDYLDELLERGDSRLSKDAVADIAGALSADDENGDDREFFRHLLEVGMKNVSPRDRNIVLELYGFYDGVEKTLEHVGERHGLTKERIRQIAAKTMDTMKRSIRSYLADAKMELTL